MPVIIIPTYSKFYDAEEGIQFLPVLDPATDCFVAAAHVDEETAERFADRAAFEVLSDDEYILRQNPPAEPEPAPSATGDPLSDQADKKSKAGQKSDTVTSDPLNGPPPPASK